MAETSEPRGRTWAAFLAGAVVMLLIVLVWMAWTHTGDAVGAFRSVIGLPHAPDLPSLPNPPPEGPHPPRTPLPTPR